MSQGDQDGCREVIGAILFAVAVLTGIIVYVTFFLRT